MCKKGREADRELKQKEENSLNNKMLGLLLETAKRMAVSALADATSSVKEGAGKKELLEILSNCVDSRTLEIFPQFPGRLFASLDAAKEEIAVSVQKLQSAGKIAEEATRLFIEAGQGFAQGQTLDPVVVSVYFLNILQPYLAYYKAEEKNAFIHNGPLSSLFINMLSMT